MAKANRARIVQAVDGALVVSEVAIDDLFPAMEIRGARFSGRVQPKFARGSQRIEYREEIQGAPIFENFCGPMYDGDGVVRYEDLEANQVLSS